MFFSPRTEDSIEESSANLDRPFKAKNL
jgi:hypothetical protein